MNKIAFLGLGRMGLPMARRLESTGHTLTVWNRSAARTTGFAEVAASPAEAVRDADLVITMLADPAAVEAVVAGFADELPPGAVWIDMSSVGPAAVAEVTRRFPPGTVVVDAPVMGSVGPAGSGGLTVLAGGHPADLDRVTPVLETLGRVVRCGGPGSGAALKLVLISAVIAGVAVVGEALALADSLGLPEDLVLRTLAAGPLGGAVTRATTRDADFPVRLATKDLTLAAGGPVLTAVRDLLADHPELADHDLARVVDAIRTGTDGNG
ncbi:NAD(P)-dependent oxidoreductase [Solihabitans fulvus]|uniref:NAD(P)-dependent oxidoreductase n=1 Tax=Solihabitans fulvus TaxID=1892852 RepID=A0A5B2WDJ6_9PSEU|nr:NAD(P)-dependent oxidoreductase [Solihabitans fulvus]KAA2248427.1 NAD(P)-dependent oxidoreductase [Solihabitans fulvus]